MGTSSSTRTKLESTSELAASEFLEEKDANKVRNAIRGRQPVTPEERFRFKDRILDLLFDSVEVNDATLIAVTHDHELLARFHRVVDFTDFREKAIE